MINFIIVDDNCMWLKQVSSIIDKIMIKTNFEYNKQLFLEYDDKFNKYVELELENKIYILDIRTNTRNGLDIAREIRLKEVDAIIIFLTAYPEYGNEILKSMFGIFCMILKSDNVYQLLEQSINEIIKRLNTSNQVIKIYDNNSISFIPLSKILYITIDSKKRKAIIQTDIKSIYYKKTLKALEIEYPNIFIRTHKSCLANVNRIINLDFKERKIYFNNKSSVELLSKKYKDKIKERILNIN